MPIALPISGTKIATVPWGIPMTNEVNLLRTQVDPLVAMALNDQWVAFNPVTTNVSGVPTINAAYKLLGAKTVALRYQISTAGSATAAGTIALSLPAGMTGVAFTQPFNGIKGASVIASYLFAGASAVTFHADHLGTNFTLGQALLNTRALGVVNIA